ncbi:hypothetical protein ACU8DI_01530 [Psychroserpens sp. BH13MA-6]
MAKLRLCKHCRQQFESRRSNHLYCAPSCRTKASYKRNNYKYVSGHYQKSEIETDSQLPAPLPNDELIIAVQELEDKIERINQNKNINTTSVKEAALGTMAADAGSYVAKKLFAPKMLPATKGDIESLKEQIQQLKAALNFYRPK